MSAVPFRTYGAGRFLSKTISDFKGVDLSSAPANVDDHRSPCAPNMMPDLSGKPVKRPGWHTVNTFPARVNGRWKTLWSEASLFRYLTWSGISWPFFTWNGDMSAKFCGRHRLAARVPSAALRLRNSTGCEPFGIYEVGLQFTEHGKSRS